MRPLKAGLIYFLLIFALGWVLGPIRELWAVPQFGRITALLFEAVMMLIAMVVSSRWVMRRFNVPQTLGSTIPMGLVALAILAPAEIAGVLWVRGLSRREYLASFVTTSGVISLVMFLLFAAMPTLVMLPRAYIRAHNQRPSREEETRRVNCMRAAFEPRLLILCPLAREWSFLVSTFEASLHVERLHDFKIEGAYIPDWRALVAPGGHGKTQFAVQAQYLIDQFSSVELVICAGAAGSRAPELSVGDVVVGTETVEHDYRQLFATRPLPRFPGHGPSIDVLRRLADGISGFHVAFDVIASGDEDVVTSERAQAIRDQTGAVCVAWEGSGAARAALFNGIGSLEIRAVTDAADKEAPQRFDANLPVAMANLANLLRLGLEQSRNDSQSYRRARSEPSAM